METVYTCDCGNQSWIIRYGKIECSKCHREYRLNKFLNPIDFNDLRNISVAG